MKKNFIIALFLLALPFFANGMGMPVSEDIRAAESAATSDSVQVMRPYEYFFKYLPSCVNVMNTQDIADFYLKEPSALNTKFLSTFNIRSPFADSDIKVHNMGDGIYIWEFPEPEDVPMCLYVAMVPVDGKYKCLTLEKSIMVKWVVGMAHEDGSHSSFLETDASLSAADFLKLLKDKVIPSLNSKP